MHIYTGENNVARNVSSMYVGVNGVARRVLNGYVGVNGVARQFYAAFTNPLNTDQLTLGMNTVYFTAYPSIKWQVMHIDGNYVYLALATMTDLTKFGSDAWYSGSTIATKCTDYLNNTIPNVADYLESVTVNGVTAKVFVPSYKMMSGNASSTGSDVNDPTWDWPSASASNRICQRNGSNDIYWTSSQHGRGYIWIIGGDGNFYNDAGWSWTMCFRPAVKVQYKG